MLFLSLPARAITLPNDPLYQEQWHLEKINAPFAWDQGQGSREVIVAVIDTGVDINHPDLTPNIWTNPGEVPGDGLDNERNGFIDDVHGWNFVEQNNDPRPQIERSLSRQGYTHGTVLAGIIAGLGNNAQGIVGIGWRTTIMPLRALDSSGSGSSEEVVRAIDYAVRNGARIINVSFTTFETIPAITEAVRRAKDAGVLMVAAAGNDASQNLDFKPIYPACTDGPAGENWVLGVAALNRFDQKSSFSNYGSLCVDLSAPGEEIFSTQAAAGGVLQLGSYGGYWSGTSLAAPMVSGVAALVRSLRPTISREKLIDVLKRTASPIDGLNPDYRGGLGWGRLDAARAVERAVALVPEKETNIRFAVSSEGGSPRVRLLDEGGTPVSSILAYAEGFRGGVRIAAGDVDGMGGPELITGAGPGGGPHLRVFNLDGTVKGQFFPFVSQFRGGITVAAGDLDGDGRDEIIVGAGGGISPQVKVFDGKGTLQSQFLAYSAAFLGGVEVAAADIDGDGVSEIITGAGPGGGPHLRVFDAKGNVKRQFFAFEQTYRGGVRLAAGDLDGDRKSEILVVRGSLDQSEVRVFSASGSLRNTFLAFTPGERMTITPATFDVENDGRAEIAVAGRNIKTELRGFSGVGSLLSVSSLPSDLAGNLRLVGF
ncbi:S8 family serine peptidase [Candidatus Uhrbacteria bacterium]|nr:S8 family serine peptidase [Candidatus Uhrbacteria bacterium]